MKTSRLAKIFAAAFAAGAIGLTLSAAAGAQGAVTSSAYGCELDAAIAQGRATPAQFAEAVARLTRDPNNSDIVLLDNGVRASAREILTIAASGNGVPAGAVTSAPDRSDPANFVAHLQFTNQQRALSHGDFMYAVFSGVSTGLFGTVDLCAPAPPPTSVAVSALHQSRAMPRQSTQALPVALSNPFPTSIVHGVLLGPVVGLIPPQPAPWVFTSARVNLGTPSNCGLQGAILGGWATPAQVAQAVARLPQDPNNPGVVMLGDGARARVSDIMALATAWTSLRASPASTAPDRSDPNNLTAGLLHAHGGQSMTRYQVIRQIFINSPVDLCAPLPTGASAPSVPPLSMAGYRSPPAPNPVMVAPSFAPTPPFNPVLAAALGPAVSRPVTCELDRAILWGRATQAQLAQAVARLPRDPNDPTIALLANGARARVGDISALLQGGVGLDASPLSTPPDRTDPNNIMAWLVHDNGGRALSHPDMISAIFRGVTNSTGGSVDLCASAPPQPNFIVSIGITPPNQSVAPLSPVNPLPATPQIQTTPSLNSSGNRIAVGDDMCPLRLNIETGLASDADFARAVAMLPRDPNNPDVVLLADGVRARASQLLALNQSGGIPHGNVATEPDRTNPDNFVAYHQYAYGAATGSNFVRSVFIGVSTGWGGPVNLCGPAPAPIPPTSPVLQSPPPLSIPLPATGVLVSRSASANPPIAVRLSFPCELESAIQLGTANQAQFAAAVARLPRDPNNPDIVILPDGLRARASELVAIAATGNGIPDGPVTSQSDRSNPDNLAANLRAIFRTRAMSHASFVSAIFVGVSRSQGGTVDLCSPATPTPTTPPVITPVHHPVLLNTDGPGTLRVVLTNSPQSPPLPNGVIHLSDPVSTCWTFDVQAGLWVQPPAAPSDPACARLATISPNFNITDDGPTPSVPPVTETLTPPSTPTPASNDCWLLDPSTGLWAENPVAVSENCAGQPAPTPVETDIGDPPLLTVEEVIEDLQPDTVELVEDVVDETIRETIEEVIEVCFFEEECDY